MDQSKLRQFKGLLRSLASRFSREATHFPDRGVDVVLNECDAACVYGSTILRLRDAHRSAVDLRCSHRTRQYLDLPAKLAVGPDFIQGRRIDLVPVDAV